MNEDVVSLPDNGLLPMALPGRIILRFNKPKEKVGSIFIPTNSQRVDENYALVVDVGAPTDRQEELFCYDVKGGDTVIANHHYGEEFTVGEGDDAVEYRIFRMFEIIGKVPQVPQAPKAEEPLVA